MVGGHGFPLRPRSINCCLVCVHIKPSHVPCPLTEAVSDLQTISSVGSFSPGERTALLKVATIYWVKVLTGGIYVGGHDSPLPSSCVLQATDHK